MTSILKAILGTLPWIFDEVHVMMENNDVDSTTQLCDANIVTENSDIIAQNLAKEAEREKLNIFNVYDEVEDVGQNMCPPDRL